MMQSKSLTDDFISDLKTVMRKVANDTEIPEIMNISQAAKFCHLKRGTIYKKVHYKEIPFRKKGGKLYFLKSELQAWIITE